MIDTPAPTAPLQRIRLAARHRYETLAFNESLKYRVTGRRSYRAICTHLLIEIASEAEVCRRMCRSKPTNVCSLESEGSLEGCSAAVS